MWHIAMPSVESGIHPISALKDGASGTAILPLHELSDAESYNHVTVTLSQISRIPGMGKGAEKRSESSHKSEPANKRRKMDGELNTQENTRLIYMQTRAGGIAQKFVAEKPSSGTSRRVAVPPQVVKSLATRRGMLASDTHSIAAHGAKEVGDAEFHSPQQLETAGLRQWKEKDAATKETYALRKEEMARCHILADSRVRNIIDELIASMRSKKEDQVPDVAMNLFRAMAPGKVDQISQYIIKSVKQTKGSRGEAMHDLSHGQNNLFFGNSKRNGLIKNGFDAPIIDGDISAEAKSIRDAVICLAGAGYIKFLTALNSTSASIDRQTGKALTSSAPGSYDRTLAMKNTGY